MVPWPSVRLPVRLPIVENKVVVGAHFASFCSAVSISSSSIFDDMSGGLHVGMGADLHLPTKPLDSRAFGRPRLRKGAATEGGSLIIALL